MNAEQFDSGLIMRPIFFKMGGASLRCLEDFKEIPDSVLKYKPTGLVVSAFGGVTKRLRLVVSLLEEGENATAREKFAEILCWHYKIVSQIENFPSPMSFFTEISKDFRKNIDLWEKGTVSEKETVKNSIIAQGEIISSRLVLDYLQSQNFGYRAVDARNVIFLKGESGYVIDREKTRQFLMEEVAKNQPFIMAGFVASENRNLGDNGSDISLALVAEAYVSLHKEFPRVLFYKEHVFETQNLTRAKTILSYGKFLRAMRGKDQPYVHTTAVSICAEIDCPFEVVAKNDPTFHLRVVCPKTDTQNTVKTLEKKQQTAV